MNNTTVVKCSFNRNKNSKLEYGLLIEKDNKVIILDSNLEILPDVWDYTRLFIDGLMNFSI